MPSGKLNWPLTLLLFLAGATPSVASHLRSVEIQVKRENCLSLTVEITITAYLNSQSTVLFGGPDDFLTFGDGTQQLVPETTNEIMDPALFLGRAQYKTRHTYNAHGTYIIAYSESNRNFGILNFDESGNTRFYTETSISLEAGNCNSSPTLLVPPVDRACSGIKFFHNPGAFDPDGDSLSYELVIPKKEPGAAVSGYSFPDNLRFYSNDFPAINEERNGPPTFTINAFDGTIIWDAPGIPGEYGVAIKVKEWHYNSAANTWHEAGYVIRDMQIIVEDCHNQKPKLIPPSDICVIAGTTILFDIPASDPDSDNVVIEAFSEVFTLPENRAVLQPPGGTPQSTTPPNDTASVQFSWETTCVHARSQPYRVIFKISDRPPAGPRLVQFYAVDIEVIAPSPEYENVSINPVAKEATLQWRSYPCQNVNTFQVWRRISEFPYDQPQCDFGMPASLRYKLIAEMPGTSIGYTDHDLIYGAQYCYRIVALVGTQGVSSRLSLDTCFIPKPAEAPVITNVSVESTDDKNGEILIRWTPPFDIDAQQYPPPYLYKVLRKNESDAQSVFQCVTTETIADTIYSDSGLNTGQNIYRYQIELYVPALTNAPVDSSSQASSVFLSAWPVLNAIDITWVANTPWYNYSSAHPFHMIYRSTSPGGPFDLIDSVNANENDFHYTDRGTYGNIGLTGALYYYKVKTRGTYGNPKIISPLENFSQITSGQILDTVPPCAPDPSIAMIDCGDFACNGSDYYTKLEWQPPEGTCADDVFAYEILVQSDTSNSYTSLGTVTGNVFLHTNLASLNKCYRLISIDQAGNRSDTSAVVCNSNCLNFKLPNVITPGIKDEQNDFLTTYPDENNFRQDCARFLRQVDIRILSRWGEEIFTTSLTGDETPIFWDGRTNEGKEASSGVYFYQAQVIFDTNDPSRQKQEFKGWVQLIR